MNDMDKSPIGGFFRESIEDSGGHEWSSKKDDVMESVKQQVAMANVQELLAKMTEKCFKKCIGKPGSVLASSEQKCVSLCMDRYIDSWDVISRVYQSRMQRETGNH